MQKQRLFIDDKAGFTLVELAAVVAIIGILLAVIVPRAQRARVEAKYQVLRQNCTELASWANEWGVRELESQDPRDTFNLNDYMETLSGSNNLPGVIDWVGTGNQSNWNSNGGFRQVNNPAANRNPSATVFDLTPPTNTLKNPFNGLSIFIQGNAPGAVAVIPGAIGCTWDIDTSIVVNGNRNHRYYALIFQGVDSTGVNDFHAGQGRTLAGLRNGVFVAALDPR